MIRKEDKIIMIGISFVLGISRIQHNNYETTKKSIFVKKKKFRQGMHFNVTIRAL